MRAEGTGGVDVDPRPRDGRPSARRLKDISHLYISTARRPAGFADAGARAAPPRRALRLAIAGPARPAARVEFVANLALQLARLGRRVVVVDGDPALPNVGFRLALEPRAYLGHLEPEPQARCERGLLGVRLIEGVADGSRSADWPASIHAELGSADCVLVSQGDAALARDTLRGIATASPAPAPATTLARAAPRSPMIGAWMATARRPGSASGPALAGTEAALWVVEAGPGTGTPVPESQALGDLPVRSVAWGAPEGTALEFWARVPRHPLGRLPIAVLDPEHPAARLYESLAQSLLAGFGTTGGARV